MATVQHKDIPEAQLHEPKGASTANAGDTYIANGSGSGSWATADALGSGAALAGQILIADGSGGLDFMRYQGWSQWEDSRTTVGTPTQTLTAGARTKLINDGGTLTIQKNPSDLVSAMWNTTTNKHVPIAENDIYHIRLSFYAENYAGATPYIEVELDIGGSVGVIMGRDMSLRKGGAAQFMSLSFPVFSGSTYLANGGEFYLTYQGTGTCDIYKTSLLIVRESKNYV